MVEAEEKRIAERKANEAAAPNSKAEDKASDKSQKADQSEKVDDKSQEAEQTEKAEAQA